MTVPPALRDRGSSTFSASRPSQQSSRTATASTRGLRAQRRLVPPGPGPFSIDDLLETLGGLTRAALGSVTVLHDGGVRVELPAMREAHPRWVSADEPVLRGFHGTDAAGCLGILQSGGIEPDGWGLVFWHATPDANRPHKLQEYWRSVQRRLSRQVWFELVCRSGSSTLTYGGHADEKRECDVHGCCRKKNSQGAVLRTTSLPDALTCTALWIPAAIFDDGEFLQQLRDFRGFGLP